MLRRCSTANFVDEKTPSSLDPTGLNPPCLGFKPVKQKKKSPRFSRGIKVYIHSRKTHIDRDPQPMIVWKKSFLSTMGKMSCVHASFRFFWGVSHWFREFAGHKKPRFVCKFPLFLGIRRLQHSLCWLPAKLKHLDGFNHPSLIGNDVLLIYKLATAF